MNATTEKLNILLVEDNEEDVELLTVALEKAGVRHALKVCADGDTALAALASWPAQEPPPHVLILDLNLPRMNGDEVLKKVRGDTRFASLPAIVMTTAITDADKLAISRVDRTSVLMKPFNFDGYKEVVDRIRRAGTETA